MDTPDLPSHNRPPTIPLKRRDLVGLPWPRRQRTPWARALRAPAALSLSPAGRRGHAGCCAARGVLTASTLMVDPPWRGRPPWWRDGCVDLPSPLCCTCRCRGHRPGGQTGVSNRRAAVYVQRELSAGGQPPQTGRSAVWRTSTAAGATGAVLHDTPMHGCGLCRCRGAPRTPSRAAATPPRNRAASHRVPPLPPQRRVRLRVVRQPPATPPGESAAQRQRCPPQRTQACCVSRGPWGVRATRAGPGPEGPWATRPGLIWNGVGRRASGGLVGVWGTSPPRGGEGRGGEGRAQQCIIDAAPTRGACTVYSTYSTHHPARRCGTGLANDNDDDDDNAGTGMVGPCRAAARPPRSWWREPSRP